MSRQNDEVGEAAEEGDRCPFEEVLGSGDCSKGCEGFEDVDFRFACVLGLRLRALARFSRLESESSGSWSSEMASGEVALFAAAGRVMGAK